ncbi:GNAT family N-acetyltransferase [Streptomyces sp. Qhu-G9]|uniref:GNAT family N-acetyltransferase n=1 Tax=Streptomyces sp. Qhu-G9 TaxID=3452799 RepID=UPI0022AC61F3|nr:GNAT family N-acetyltransferase [Streptomyces aurantiacus]WAU83492.1 GNAT family N-acetyltransferase [Streptomyces aurantiacus]
MDLRPFGTGHATTVASWPASAAEVVMWCGLRDFPVAGPTVAAWQHEPDVTAHVLVEGEQLVGYGELWFDAEEDEVELARIIVAPGARGRGLGRVLVRGLLAEARHSGLSEVFVRVHPDNAGALRCYRGAGFGRVDAESAEAWNAGQPVDYVWLRHT